jgi:Domain of unknown function (DUF1707)
MDLEPGGEQRPKLRASDADRERAVALLRRRHADGRLDLEEFEQRVDKAYAARTVDPGGEESLEERRDRRSHPG